MTGNETNQVERDYEAACDACGCTMDGETYQAAEALSHQVGGDQVDCPGCGAHDWTFTQVED